MTKERHRSSKEQQGSVPGRRPQLASQPGFCSAEILPRAERDDTELKSPSVLAKMKCLPICVFVRHLRHIEVRRGNNRTQNSTALCGKDDEIMALCMVTDTGFISLLCKSALGRFAVSITFFFFFPPCPHVFHTLSHVLLRCWMFLLISSRLRPTQPCCSVVAASVPTAEEWLPGSAS